MKIPYGESNFKKIISNNFLYIDKTAYVRTLEDVSSFNILLRPRRFGKSLFLSSLRYYYDIAYKDAFKDIFGGLDIGKNPTPLKNSYQMLLMDFSGIEVDSPESIRRDFTLEVKTKLIDFLQRYDYPAETTNRVEEQSNPAAAMKVFFTMIDQAEPEYVPGFGL